MTENNSYFIALTGAKKNIGDYLITERGISLLKHILPEYQYHVHPNWLEINDIRYINESNGIIILGGPGYQMNMFPDVYNFVADINAVKVPIYLLGSGWYGKPGDKISEQLYRFTDSSKKVLSKINSSIAGLSCRDYQSIRVLNANGFENAVMTGCPVWYDIDSLNKEFIVPSKIKRILFTPAQRVVYSNQTIEILKFLKRKYNDTEIIVSFHRGLGYTDEYTQKSDADNTLRIANIAKKLGMEVIDVAYDLKKIKFYEECDLHIGYRVHAHIYFLSKRMPSVLIHEDGRGTGATEALKSPGINAYSTRKLFSNFFRVFKRNILLVRTYGKIGLKINQNVIHELNKILYDVEKDSFNIYKEVAQQIDDKYIVMENFIKNIVNR